MKMALFQIGSEMISALDDLDDEEIQAFAELQEDITCDAQTELFIYTCFIALIKTWLMKYLEKALQRAEWWIAVTSQDHPDRVRRMRIFDDVSYWNLRLGEPTSQAITSDTASAQGCPDADDRAAELTDNYERTGILRYLEEAIRRTEQALGVSSTINRLNNLVVMLGLRFDRTGEIHHLDRAIEIGERIVAVTPVDHSDRGGFLSNLGNQFGRRFDRTGEMNDLDHAVEILEKAVAISVDHSMNLGTWLNTRFKRCGILSDIDRAIEIAEKAVTIVEHPNRAGYLSSLGKWLGERFQRTGKMNDLDRAVEAVEEAVAIIPVDHFKRAGYLNNLANELGRRFERFGKTSDLDRAVEIAEKTVTIVPADHPNRAGHLSNLGLHLVTRFYETGKMNDLDRAVESSEEAVKITPVDHPDRIGRLSNLASRLSDRFERIGEMNDLDRAVEIAEKIVSIIPADHSHLAPYLNNLGNGLGLRYDQTGNMDDLDRAVEVAEKAVTITPADHSDRAMYLSNLANRLGSRLKKLNDLDRAVEVAEEAVTITSVDHFARVMYLNNLGNQLSRRYTRCERLNDLDRAIEVTRKAVTATPPDRPNRAGFLKNLGFMLHQRFRHTGEMKNLEEAIISFKSGWNCKNAPASVRIMSAQYAAELLAAQENWEESSNILRDAVMLLPSISPRSLKNSDKQHILSDFSGLASRAAAATLNAGKDAYHALKLLELGRGIIAGLLLDIRTDTSDLKEKHPKLAEDFESLRDELDSPGHENPPPLSGDSTPSWENKFKRRHEADARLAEVCEKIRAQPGFRNFLLPSTASELMAAAEPGPIVVINTSRYGCDAFLVQSHQIERVRLPGLNLKDAEEKAQHPSLNLSSTLKWLWNVIAHRILDALGFQSRPSDDNLPHVWWILTGALSHLPLHAAGDHAHGPTATVLDRVMSSYTSSIKALIYGRRHSVQKSVGTVSEQALLVAMRETPGNSVLPFAADEVKMLSNLCPSLGLKSVIPPQLKEDVLKNLSTCKVFHFAGHGRSDPSDPSRSCLLLKDWKENPLTVGDLRDHRLQKNPPFLAYLSACSTGANRVQDLIDENIHLVSAFQLAGFRHVVGTLWEVSDAHCVDVAAALYKTICEEGMTDLTICRGLHRAVRALRDGHLEVRRSAQERSTPLTGAVQYSGLKVMKVDDNRLERKVAETNDTSTAEPDPENGMRVERDATLYGSENVEKRQESPMYWAPYIHFGV